MKGESSIRLVFFFCCCSFCFVSCCYHLLSSCFLVDHSLLFNCKASLFLLLLSIVLLWVFPFFSPFFSHSYFRRLECHSRASEPEKPMLRKYTCSHTSTLCSWPAWTKSLILVTIFFFSFSCGKRRWHVLCDALLHFWVEERHGMALSFSAHIFLKGTVLFFLSSGCDTVLFLFFFCFPFLIT